MIKIVSWNINGFRSGFNELKNFIILENPDVICLQEVKASEIDLVEKIKLLDGYNFYLFNAQKKGYSSVAILSKVKPRRIIKGIGTKEFDDEGRAIIAIFDDLTLANIYFPHSGRDLNRLEFKLRFNDAVLKFITPFVKNKLLICGDLNVAHKPIDIARPKQNEKNAGFTSIERKWMDEVESLGLVDIYRFFNPNKQEFTWWSNMFGARNRNIGWRIDYFLCYKSLLNKIKSTRIYTNIMGSDHCPIAIEMDINLNKKSSIIT